MSVMARTITLHALDAFPDLAYRGAEIRYVVDGVHRLASIVDYDPETRLATVEEVVLAVRDGWRLCPGWV